MSQARRDPADEEIAKLVNGAIDNAVYIQENPNANKIARDLRDLYKGNYTKHSMEALRTLIQEYNRAGGQYVKGPPYADWDKYWRDTRKKIEKHLNAKKEEPPPPYEA